MKKILFMLCLFRASCQIQTQYQIVDCKNQDCVSGAGYKVCSNYTGLGTLGSCYSTCLCSMKEAEAVKKQLEK